MEDETLKREAYPQERPPEHDGYYVVSEYIPGGTCPMCKRYVVWILVDSGALLPLDPAYARINTEGELELRAHAQSCIYRDRWENREWRS
jgi:hypothetical protein